MRSASPSARALSLCWVAWSLRVCEFCRSATSKNVMIMVAVLMMSCQVSRLKIPIDGPQITISKTQPAKNGARLAKLDAAPAKRSKKPTRPVTELGMLPDSTAALSFVMTATEPSQPEADGIRAHVGHPSLASDSVTDSEDKAAHPEQDADWDADQRGETPLERLDRNWGDLLQELRVVQTGVQLLTGFLLTLPFQSRFAQLHQFQQDVYLTTVAVAIASTGFLIAPVLIHRILFRRHARKIMVTAAHRLALIGTILLGAAVIGVVLLLFDVVRGRGTAITAAASTLGLLLLLWAALPWALRTKTDR